MERGITWSQTLTQNVDRIIAKFDEWMSKIFNLPSAAQTAATEVGNALSRVQIDPIHIPFVYDSPDFPDFNVSSAAMGGYVTQSGIAYLGSGGWLSKGTDTVRAMLSPGESVLTPRATTTLGLDAVRALNNGATMTSGSGDAGDIVAGLNAIRAELRGLPMIMRTAIRDGAQRAAPGRR